MPHYDVREVKNRVM